MKNLKCLGVLLVGLFMPLIVNADTAVINDASALETCVKTSDTCQINKDIVIEDIDFVEGTIEIPEGKTLTISGNTKVSANATIIVNGTIVIDAGAVLDASLMSFGSKGLIANQSGKLTIKNNGTFIGLDYWEKAYESQGGWSPIIGKHLFSNCEDNARVVSGNRTFVMIDGEWKGFAKIGDVYYNSIQDAINAVPNDEKITIEILKSVSTPGFIASAGKNIVIDLKGNELKLTKPLVGSLGTETQNMQLLKGSNVTLKNGTIKAAKEAKRLIQNYANLTLENITLDATTMDIKTGYALSFNNGQVEIKGNTNIYAHDYAFDVYYWTKMGYVDGAHVIIDTTGTIKGAIEIAGDKLPSKSTLKIININHEGKLSVSKDYEDNIIIEGGKFTTDVNELLKNENFRALKKDNVYVIEKKHSVILAKGEGEGDIIFSKDFAFPGETIEIKYDLAEGYEFDSIKLIEEETGKEIKVENNKFIMPSTDVFAEVIFKPIKTVETPAVDKDNSIGVSDDKENTNILLDTIAKEDKYKDMPVTIVVVVEDVKSDEIDEKISDAFIKALENKEVTSGKIVNYFDITIDVKNTLTDKIEGNLEKLTDKLEFTVAIPKLDDVKEGFVRNYYIIKKHKDKVEVLDTVLSQDGKYITFETDEFSTYALAYEDKVKTMADDKVETPKDEEKVDTKPEVNVGGEEQPEVAPENNVEVPQTSDGIISTIILTGIALICLAAINYYFKKELNRKGL